MSDIELIELAKLVENLESKRAHNGKTIDMIDTFIDVLDNQKIIQQARQRKKES